MPAAFCGALLHAERLLGVCEAHEQSSVCSQCGCHLWSAVCYRSEFLLLLLLLLHLLLLFLPLFQATALGVTVLVRFLHICDCLATMQVATFRLWLTVLAEESYGEYAGEWSGKADRQ